MASLEPVLDARLPGIHLFEVKASHKGDLGSFGAFTLGEIIAARLSLHQPMFTYSILYVWRQNDGSYAVEDIPVSEELLANAVAFPHVKYYLYRSFIAHYAPGAVASVSMSKLKRSGDDNAAMKYVKDAVADSVDALIARYTKM